MKGLRTRRHQLVIEVMKAARLEAGMTQHQLAKRIKRPQSFVSLYEKGDRRVEITEFLEIADALKTDPGALVARMRL